MPRADARPERAASPYPVLFDTTLKIEMSLNRRFRPVTFGMGLIRESRSTIVGRMISWRRSIGDSVGHESFSGLDQALERLQPLTIPETKFALVETQSPWTAIFSNSAVSAAPSNVVAYLSRDLRREAVCVAIVPPSCDEEGVAVLHGITQFEKFADHDTDFLNYERSIEVAAEDGRWHFEASGIPLPFEELQRYSARAVRERFTPDMLERYCAALGARPFDPSFYGNHADLVEIQSEVIQRSVSYEEAQRDLHLASDESA